MDVVTQESFGADVVEASRDQPVLVDVWGPRCAPCLAMMPFVEQLAESQRGALRVVKLNSAEARRLCFELNVMGLPTFMLFQDGQEVWRLSGDTATPAGVRGKLGLAWSPRQGTDTHA